MSELLREVENYPGGGSLAIYEEENGSEPKTIAVSKIWATAGDDKMLMDVFARLPSGKGQVLRILVDTGAEVNLIKEGLLPRAEFSKASRRLNLTTANGQPMRGGDVSVKTTLIFSRHADGIGKGDFGVEAEFHEADINVDAILGNPWLCKRRIAVFPYEHAIAVERDSHHLDLLFSNVPHRRRHHLHKRKAKAKRNVRTVSAQELGDSEGRGWLANLRLEIPHFDDYARTLVLSEKEHEYVREKIVEHDQLHVQTVVVAKGDSAEENPFVEELRKKVHLEYDGVVLRNEVIPDPPVRGLHGNAFITLKEGAVPQRSKPFRQFGEKHDALVKITQGWIDNKYIERATDLQTEWLSQYFAGPKSLQLFPGGGL